MKTTFFFKTVLSLVIFCLITVFVAERAFSEQKPTLEELQNRLDALEAQVAEYKKVIEIYKEMNNVQNDQMEGKVGKVKARKKPGPIFTEPSMPGTFKIGANITPLVQFSPDTKLVNQQKESRVGGSYQANVTLTNEFDAVNGMALANLRLCEGQGLQDEFTIYSNVDNNAGTDNYFFLSEIFYEQHLFDDRIIINFGKLDPTVFFDINRYACSDTTQFIAKIFNNSPVIEFPANAGGIRASIFPWHWVNIGYIVMSGQRDLRNIGANLFHLAEIEFTPKLNGRPGHYSFLAWINNNNHISWNDQAKTEEYAHGFSISCDQEITDAVGLFAKFGWQDPEVYNQDIRAYPASLTSVPDRNCFSLEYMWSAGIQVKGHPWGRDNDFLGVAFGQAIPSKDMKNALSNTVNDRRDAKNEGHFEAYYNIFFNKYLAITPSLQLILNQYGGDAENEDIVTVYTLRSHFDF